MDNKQILEEIDIIVRAKVDSAKEEIKSVVKTTDKMISNIQSSMSKLNNMDVSSIGKSVGNSLNKTKESITEVKNQINDLNKVVKNKIDFNFNSNDVDEIRKELAILGEERDNLARKFSTQNDLFTSEDSDSLDKIVWKIKKLEDQLSEMSYNPIEINTNADEIEPKISTAIDSLKNVTSEVYTLEEKLKDFDCMKISEQISTIKEQVFSAYPQIKNMVDEFNQRINESDSLLGMLVSSIKNIGNFASSSVNKITTSFNKMKENVSGSFTNIFTSVKAKIGPLDSILTNVGKTAKNSFIQANIKIKEFASKLSSVKNKISNLISGINGIGKEFNKHKKTGDTFSNSLEKGLKKGIKSIKSFALSLLSIRTAFTALSKASQAYLSFDTELSNELQNCWNVLGSLLAPILEYLIGLFNKLVSAVAQFVKVLTGIDLVARANAKSLDKQTKSASKASKALSSIDDIEVLNSGSGSQKITKIKVDKIDTTPIEEFYLKVKDIFDQIFDPFKTAWEEVGKTVFDDISTAVQNVSDLGTTVFTSMLDVWSNGTGLDIVKNYISIFDSLVQIIGNVAKAFKIAWDNAGSGKGIIQSISDIIKTIQQFTLDVADSILKWTISPEFQEALNKVFEVIKDIFEIINEIAQWILKMYETYIKPVIDEKLLPAISSIITALGDIWKVIKPTVDNIIKTVETRLEPIIQGLASQIGGIIDIIKGIADFVSGVFSGDWKKAWEGIKLIFKGFLDSLVSALKTPVNLMLACVETFINAVIGGFNKLKKSINKMSFDVPDWVPGIGGKKWGFNLKLSDEISLPRLKDGGVAYEETKVVVGEYANARTNPEIISPVSLMEDTINRSLNNREEVGTRIDTLRIDVAGETFYQGAVDYINEENTRKGVNIIKEV